MPPRKDDEDLLAQLDQLGVEEQQQAQQQTTKTSGKATSQASSNEKKAEQQEEDDPLAALQAQLAPRATTSRPATPRLSSSTNSGSKRTEHTPASSGQASARNSEDRLRGSAGGAQTRRSVESVRTYHEGQTPATPAVTVGHDEEKEEKKGTSKKEMEAQVDAAAPKDQGGGGWWGSMFSAASAAVKQAETLAKDISRNEEAQRWAEQVKGNISNLQSFSGFSTYCIRVRGH